MALYLIERSFAEELEIGANDVLGIQAINDELDIRWVLSFLSADKKKTYCLYEAADAELIVEAARRAGLPADVVIAVDEIRPEEILARG